MNSAIDQRLLTAREAAELLCVPIYFLTKSAKRRALGLPYYRIGHLVRFKRTDLADWLQAQCRTSDAVAIEPTIPVNGEHHHAGL